MISSQELYLSFRQRLESHAPSTLLAIFVAFIFVSQIATTVKALWSPLKKVPGPWYAPLTTLHLRYAFATGTIWKWVEGCHEAYGPIFRLGPRQIWVSDKDAMKVILQKVDLPKVAMYAEVSRDPLSPGLFGEVYVSVLHWFYAVLQSSCADGLVDRDHTKT